MSVIRFDLSDCECEHSNIIVETEKDLNNREVNLIQKEIERKYDEVTEAEDYSVTDEQIVSSVMEKISKELKFNYKIIHFDYTISM